MKCSQCRFFYHPSKDTEIGYGECRLNPVVVTGISGTQYWCGQFKELPKPCKQDLTRVDMVDIDI